MLGVLPPSGMERPESFVMPALTMAIILTATNVRLVRTSMLETLSQQYIMVARSKGLRDRVVLYKHALRNSAIPLVTYIGLQFGGLIGGIVIVERVFNWPGMGTLAFDAISAATIRCCRARSRCWRSSSFSSISWSISPMG